MIRRCGFPWEFGGSYCLQCWCLRILPPSPLPSKAREKWLLSQRDHRKIFVVDGTVAFTGGINISSVYSKSLSGRFHYGDDQRIFRVQHFWRDTDVQIDGAAVAEFQKLFLETWARENGPEFFNRNYFLPLKQCLTKISGSPIKSI
jgi:cardiolipin synthase